MKLTVRFGSDTNETNFLYDLDAVSGVEHATRLPDGKGLIVHYDGVTEVPELVALIEEHGGWLIPE